MLTLAPHERVGGKKGGDVIFRMIVQGLRGREGLLILDEAQHLLLPALESLRSIHDATECGLVLMGSESVYARLPSRIKPHLKLAQTAFKPGLTRMASRIL